MPPQNPYTPNFSSDAYNDIFQQVFGSAQNPFRNPFRHTTQSSTPARKYAPDLNDAQRVQQLIDKLPHWNIAVTTLRPKAARTMLVQMGVKDAEQVCEADVLYKMLGDRVFVECPVCLTAHQEGDCVVRLPCSHWFHRGCAHSAAQASFEQAVARGDSWPVPACPVCRREVRSTGAKKRAREE